MRMSYQASVPILVSGGCHNLIPQTRGLKEQIFVLFSHSMEAGRPRSRCRQGW